MNKDKTKITLPFDILPQIKGYRPHQDEIQSKLFPNCCKFHESVYKVLKKRFESYFEKFAKDFEERSGLKHNITDYPSLPSKLITQLSYMEYFLAEKIDSPTWFRDFMHYLDYNTWSFGTPGLGVTWYFDLVKMYLLNVDDKIEKRKKELLVAELDYRNNSIMWNAKVRSYSNPELIHETIQKWLSILPFKGKELKRFIKENKWQSLSGIIEINQFDARLDTVIPILIEDVIDGLKYETTRLLSETNNKERYQKLTKEELDNYEFRLNKEKHDLKQKRLLGEFISNEFSYLDILKEWLKNEKRFIKKYIGHSEKQINEFNRIHTGVNTFETKYTKSELSEIRLQLLAEGYISKISENDFLYLFQNKPINGSIKKLIWKKKRSRAHDFFKKAVYVDKQFSSSQINRCVNFPDGLKMNAGCKSGDYNETDNLLP